MKLLVNTSLLRFGGAVQVALSVLRESRAFPEHEYHVVLGSGVGRSLDRSEFPENFTFHERNFGVMGLRKVPQVQRAMSELEKQIHPDCVLTTSGPAFWKSRAPHVMGFNRPLYIYPESPYVQNLPIKKKARLAAIRAVHGRFFRREADAFIVQTDDVNQRVRSWFNSDSVRTITNTHSSFYSNPAAFPNRLREPRPDVFRFLTVTNYYPHKNLEIIPAILKQLEQSGIENIEFVLTLTPEDYQREIGPIPQGLHPVGPVAPMECPSLYAECDGMFLPTLAECFSASYPEAMKMRKPIVTTYLGFARSICCEAAIYFKACDVSDAAQLIAALVDDESLQQKLKDAGEQRLQVFDTPAERARKILQICEQTVQRSR